MKLFATVPLILAQLAGLALASPAPADGTEPGIVPYRHCYRHCVPIHVSGPRCRAGMVRNSAMPTIPSPPFPGVRHLFHSCLVHTAPPSYVCVARALEPPDPCFHHYASPFCPMSSINVRFLRW
jgi:hypothetical protein